ncbi:conserved hypothetical protein [Theileria equi strain WA]|uniref:Signal peptide containing protein n=1 Tax=Theileria equi strain WA TaxID=1537102 RepID=L1LC67_THEEQ|nr:conserved hypothetical protein [Theileria equi strain WA]EKX72743.1 conserved hypothetical protein [Theileria equi strain WA]|eukprot:XP_004832195.1 conserved hypothetical protein [Theileria equi strain WA]
MMKSVKYLLILISLPRILAKGKSGSSQDVLQSQTCIDPNFGNKGSDLKADNGLGDENGQFTNYLDNFSKSESGQFLQEVLAFKPGAEGRYKITPGSDKLIELKSMILPYNTTWNILNLVLLALTSAVFTHIAIYAPLSNYSIITITGYVTCSIILGLTHDILPLWIVALVACLGEGVLCFALNKIANIQRRQLCILSICMVFSKVFYDLYAIIPFDPINPSYSGVAGLILNYVIFRNNFMLLRLIYLIVLIFISSALFLNLPSYVAGEPMEIQEVDASAVIMRRLIAFVTALPVSGLLTQILCTAKRTVNPLGPFNFFNVPTKFRIDSLESVIGMVGWVTISMIFYKYSKKRNNGLATSPKKRKTWRTYTRTISSL